MARTFRTTARALMAAAVTLVLGFGLAQSVSAATRTSGPSARADCVEGNCDDYCIPLGFSGGTCPVNGGHCICQ